MRKLNAGNRIEAVRKAAALGLIDGAGPSPADPTSSPDTVVYNDESAPILSSELRVTPFKVDKLERSREPHDGSTNRDT
jgi:hypothetical protein